MIERFVTGPRIVDDLLHGQIVIIVARWILVLAGLLLALWNPPSLAELRVEILVLLCLAVTNFYLHLHLIVQRQSQPLIVYAASVFDLAIVTLLIGVQGGYDSNLYIFYYPAVLGFALAFPRLLTACYAAGAISAYGLIGALTVGTMADMQEVVGRLLVLVAIAACGSLYLRLETERRSDGGLTQPATRHMGDSIQMPGTPESGVS